MVNTWHAIVNSAIATLILVCDSVMLYDPCYLGFAVQEVLHSQWCVELWCAHVWDMESGTQAIWRKDQPSGELKFVVDVICYLINIHNNIHAGIPNDWVRLPTSSSSWLHKGIVWNHDSVLVRLVCIVDWHHLSCWQCWIIMNAQ